MTKPSRSWRHTLPLLWERCSQSVDEQLRRACARGDLARAQVLVAPGGACVNAARPRREHDHFLVPSERTPLHLAAMCGQPDVVAWLLREGATAGVYVRPRCDNPVHLAACQLKECVQRGDDPTDHRRAIGLLWRAQPALLRQENKLGQPAWRDLGVPEHQLDQWAQAACFDAAIPDAVLPAAARGRL